MRTRIVIVAGALLCCAFAAAALAWNAGGGWTDAELTQLRSLSIASLPPLPADPSNRVADDPRAAELGHRLFFDPRLSANGKVSCASCHAPDKQFQDGTPFGKGVGTTDRRTMSIVGTAHSPWQFWDGRKDSQWSQALGPLESPVEHGGDRTQYARVIAAHYRADYEAVFGTMPDLSSLPLHAGPVPDAGARAAWEAMQPRNREAVTTVFANLGKAIAAYERQIMPGPSRLDAYVEAATRADTKTMQSTLTKDEIAGLRLFLGRANCIQCHNGPLLTNNDFHNTGVPPVRGMPLDDGRASGARKVLADEFNCLSRYSDARPEDCQELRFLSADAHRQQRQFRPTSLRNVAERAPYMHAGQFSTLEQVVDHYNRAPAAPLGHSELKPLGLDDRETAQIVDFLRTLSGPIRADERWLREPPRGHEALSKRPRRP
jgi:cytochrome c peroxidase